MMWIEQVISLYHLALLKQLLGLYNDSFLIQIRFWFISYLFNCIHFATIFVSFSYCPGCYSFIWINFSLRYCCELYRAEFQTDSLWTFWTIHSNNLFIIVVCFGNQTILVTFNIFSSLKQIVSLVNSILPSPNSIFNILSYFKMWSVHTTG